jgi:hypothetical protein
MEEDAMTALAAPYDARMKPGEMTRYPVAAGAFCYKGGLAVLNGGYAQPAADAAGTQFVGVFAESADNLTGAIQPGFVEPSIGSPSPPLPSGIAQGSAGAIGARVYKEGAFVFSKAGAVQSDVGKQAFVVDDNTVSTSATTHNVACGYVVELIDASHVRVRIDLAVN